MKAYLLVSVFPNICLFPIIIMCKEVHYTFRCGHLGGPQIFPCNITRGVCHVKRQARYVLELCYVCKMAGDVR